MEDFQKLQSIAVGVAALSQACYELYKIIEEEEQPVRRRSCWVKPWRESRDVSGDIHKLLKEYQLYDDSEAYKMFLRMDVSSFTEILSFVEQDIARSDTKLRKCIPVSEKLAATLRFLGTGESFKELAQNTKLSTAYLCESIMEVCSAIYRNMGPTFLKFPRSKSEWLRIAKEFETIWQFPNCIGALDGKHIAMTPARENANLFYNYKGFHSIVLLAVADAFGKFIFIDVGCNGRISDGGVFSRSVLSRILDNDDNFPEDRIIGNGRQLPYTLVADNAFPLSKRIATPFNRKELVGDEVVFNQRLSRARQNVERSFGMLSQRFQVLQNRIRLREDKAKRIVQASCVLHNFLIEKSSWYREGLQNVQLEAEISTTPHGSSSNRSGQDIRACFKEFFSSEGRI